ncbi:MULTISPECIES: hypothetical protein [Mesorhizobium]|jgi:hypothetical protein|uniref:Uncharacterized protein n=2 Tax=Hyphomicrobiales TaxID=356 RepID=A0A1C2DZA0_9HYPH|nr:MULTISPECIES: hypothetical protein [Mesorhizobium]MDQ0328978.1 hypothetical protein [Mesorhizobium sp. YL-MeA3-2017]OCX20005.1 hypothetical protein QV13_10485 [Mesorhizobium hungaricum]
MQFGIVRSNAPGCEPTCPEWISAEGAIQASTPALFKRVLKILDGRKLPIIIDSPGGDVNAAMALGRLIRKNKLDIAVGKTHCDGSSSYSSSCIATGEGVITQYVGNLFDHGAICNSACPLMFAGGNRRLVGNQAFLGVHQVTTTHTRIIRHYRTTYRTVRGKRYKITTETSTQDNAGSYKTYKMSKSLEKKLGAYLKEMGVEQDVLVTMKNTPASAIHQLVPQNMLKMKLVTSLDSLDLLTGKQVCSNNPLPANCRTIMPPADKPKLSNDATEAAILPSDVKSRSLPCANKKDGSQLIGLSPNVGEACRENHAAEPSDQPLPGWPAKDWTQPTGPYSNP